jgi:1-acyl-sn-glycerol-3-phosphate acyltransferase
VWLPLLACVRIFDRDPAHKRTARWMRRLGRMLGRVNPWRLHLTGTENVRPHQAYVIVSNHQSLADIPVLCYLRTDTKWMAKAELFKIPVVGWLMRMAGDVRVDRGNARKAAQALLECGKCLRAGSSVVMFPEGTRSLDGKLLPFFDGPFQLAIRERTPILPVLVNGTLAALPRHTWLFGGALDISLTVLPEVGVTEYSTKQAAQLRDHVRQIMEENLKAS